MMNYPPAAHLMALYLMSEDEEALNRGAVRLKALAMSHTRQEIALIGPSDAGLSKLKDVYRKVLYLKCTEMNYLTEWKLSLIHILFRIFFQIQSVHFQILDTNAKFQKQTLHGVILIK